MRLMRSSNGRVALEIGGNNVISFIRIDSEGPIFDASERKSFYKTYCFVLDTPIGDALMSMLLAAKRGYRHHQDVCEFLWRELMAKIFSEMTLAELILQYNKLADQLNVPRRKSFSSKAEAVTAIGRLDGQVTKPTEFQQRNEGSKMTKKVDENGNAVPAEQPKARGKGIGKRAMELILEGKSNKEVIDIVKAEIEGANPTAATMAWYRNKLRQEGKLPPATRGKKAEAVPEAETEGDGEDEAEAA